MRLFIAEKASLAKAIVEAHPGRIKSRDRLSVTMDNGDVVCWSAGHILTMQTPDMIDAEYKRWRVAPLPIIPREWPKFPDQETRLWHFCLTNPVILSLFKNTRYYIY